LAIIMVQQPQIFFFSLVKGPAGMMGCGAPEKLK
jgi:hypothetical protein